MEHLTAEATTIGIDLGDKQSVVCALHRDGRMEFPGPVKTTRKAFREFFALPTAHVVIEVGTHSRWASELLREMGHRVTVANARQVRLISQSHSKSDRTDAEVLARLGRADRALLFPIRHRDRKTQLDLAVVKSRDQLVRIRTQLVNHVRATVKSFGERLPSCTSASFHAKAYEGLPTEFKPLFSHTFRVLRQIEAEIRKLDKAITRTAAKYPEVERVSQPKGVGTLTALAFVLTLEDKQRFAKSRCVGSYLGLRPKKDQSGDLDKQLRITKAGDAYLRRLLVGSAHYILGPFGQDSDLRRWGLRLCARGGRNAKRRAVVAVARKLSVLLHRLWVTGEAYQPIGYVQGRKAA
jgi:transposase